MPKGATTLAKPLATRFPTHNNSLPSVLKPNCYWESLAGNLGGRKILARSSDRGRREFKELG